MAGGPAVADGFTRVIAPLATIGTLHVQARSEARTEKQHKRQRDKPEEQGSAEGLQHTIILRTTGANDCE